jgi:phage portal protein BeeE
MSLLFRTRPAVAERSQIGFAEYTKLIEPWLPWFTQKPTNRETTERTLAGMTRHAHSTNGVAFSCAAVRMQVFSEVTFKWQDKATKRLYGTPDLLPLEQPWVGAGSDDLLARMEQDATVAGNSYWVDEGSMVRDDRVSLLRLQPEYVTIVLEVVEHRLGGNLGRKKVGYVYAEPDQEPVYLDVAEVAHFAPLPDPRAQYRGMSWLSAVLPDVDIDTSLQDFKQNFIANQATPNLVISFDPTVSPEQFARLTEVIRSKAAGTANAGKTLALGGGADVKVVGSNFEQLAIKAVQGAGETRIASAAGVPPVIVGLSEGLSGSSLNEGNYGQARRRFADATMRPNWRSATTALATLVTPPDGSRLWFDTADVAFLQEDQADDATIREAHARTIRALVDAGFSPEAAVSAATDGNFDGLGASHSGLFSVQLQPPGSGTEPARSALVPLADEVRTAAPEMHIHLPETIDVQMRQEPIIIPAPVVNVPAPVVNVTVDPTPIEVAAPVVNVAAPEVTVNVPTVPVQLSMEMPESEPETEGPERKKVTFRRDKDGRIVSAELVEED